MAMRKDPSHAQPVFRGIARMLVLCSMLILQATADAQPSLRPDLETSRAAINLLKDAVTVEGDGRHNRLLRSLRHLQDPTLGPLFSGLTLQDHPALRIHGLLGLAEIAEPPGLTIQTVQQIERPDVRAELISAALDGGLVNLPLSDALLDWQGLAPQVKLLLATQRVNDKSFGPDSPARKAAIQALSDPALGQRGLAAMLLHQAGDPRGVEGLIALNNDTSAGRDPVRAMLLETATAHDFNRVGPWAYSLCTDPGLPPRLEMLALQTAIRFADGRAITRWQRLFNEAEDISGKTRLALAGLEVSPWLPPEAFDALVSSADDFIARIGRAGQAVSALHRGEPGEAPLRAINQLLAVDQPMANVWVSDYAAQHAPTDLAVAVSERIVLGYETGETVGRTRRLDAVLRATQTLIERTPDEAAKTLTEQLRREDADVSWQQVILLGLIRSRSEVSVAVSHRLGRYDDPDVSALALVLYLQNGEPLSGPQALELERLVRGEVRLDDSLRVQTAWEYLKRTGQGPDAIDAVLRP